MYGINLDVNCEDIEHGPFPHHSMVAVCFHFEIIKKSCWKIPTFFQLDEEASMWCPGPDKRQLQIQHSSKALRTNWTEVATQTYHLQVQAPIPTPNLVSFLLLCHFVWYMLFYDHGLRVSNQWCCIVLWKSIYSL